MKAFKGFENKPFPDEVAKYLLEKYDISLFSKDGVHYGYESCPLCVMLSKSWREGKETKCVDICPCADIRGDKCSEFIEKNILHEPREFLFGIPWIIDKRVEDQFNKMYQWLKENIIDV